MWNLSCWSNQLWYLCELRVQNPPTCDCQKGHYIKEDDSCGECDYTCNECVRTTEDCTKCSWIRELITHNEPDTPNECVCPSHYYEALDGTCHECDTKCAECSTTSENCNPCAADRV